MSDLIRCAWVPKDDALYADYHDLEWGVPVYDDRLLFEFLVLEGAQAGLSWATILRKNNEKPFSGEFLFRAAGVQVWDPSTGKASAVASKTINGVGSVGLTVPPLSCVFVTFERPR